jgi:hypothetical protein
MKFSWLCGYIHYGENFQASYGVSADADSMNRLWRQSEPARNFLDFFDVIEHIRRERPRRRFQQNRAAKRRAKLYKQNECMFCNVCSCGEIVVR